MTTVTAQRVEPNLTWVDKGLDGAKTFLKGAVTVGKTVSKVASTLLGNDFIDAISSLFSISSVRRSKYDFVIKRTNFSSIKGRNTSYAVAGDILAEIPINPKQIGQTRIKAMSGLFQKFRFSNVRMHYHPTCGAMSAGQIVGFFVYDADESVLSGGGSTNLQLAFSSYGQKPVQVKDPKTWNMELRDPAATFYNDEGTSDERLSTQARFFLMAASDFDAESASNLGTLSIEYALDFFYPKVDTTGTGASSWYAWSSTPTNTDLLKDCSLYGTNNLDVEVKGNVLTLPSGRYSIDLGITGTGIPGTSTLDMSTTGTSELKYRGASGTTDIVITGVVYNPDPFTVTFTCGTITSFTMTTCVVAALSPSLISQYSHREEKKILYPPSPISFQSTPLSSSSSSSSTSSLYDQSSSLRTDWVQLPNSQTLSSQMSSMTPNGPSQRRIF